MILVPIGELCAVAAAITWAIGSILFARIGRGVAPGAMNVGKLVVAGGLLTLTHLAIGGRFVPEHATAGAGWLLAASGILGLTIGDTAYFAAMMELGVARAILMLSTAPVFAALGGFLILGETLDARSLLGMALTMGGVGLVVARPNDPTRGSPRPSGKGLAFGLVAAVGQASGSLLSRRAMQAGVDPLAASALRIVIGAIGLTLVALAIGRVGSWSRELAKDRAWAKVAVGSLLGSYCGIWLAQTAILRASSTGVATALLATSPVFALPIAHYAGMDRMTARAGVGALLAVAGIAVLSIR